MGHTDVVNVDPTKWKHPPFSATRDGGYVYGRGTVDDKDNLAAALMTMLLAEAAERAARSRRHLPRRIRRGGHARSVGIQFMVDQHFPQIDAEYCLAEGGGVTRIGGEVKFASVQTLEKIPRGHRADGPRRRGPRIGAAQVERDRAPGAAPSRRSARGGRTSGSTKRRAPTSGGWRRSRRRRRRSVTATLVADPKVACRGRRLAPRARAAAASMLRTSVSPNIITGGYRST